MPNYRVKLILSPHIDDETICLGGSIAKWVSEGHLVHIVSVFTGGSICNGRVVGSIERIKELNKVCSLLKVENTIIFNDSQGMEDNGNNASFPETVSVAEALIGRFRLLNYPVDVYFPSVTEHQDHEYVNRCGEIMMRTSVVDSNVNYYEYPMHYRAFDDVIHGQYIDVTGYIKDKTYALLVFESQLRDSGTLSIATIIESNKMLGSILGSPDKFYEKVIVRRVFE